MGDLQVATDDFLEGKSQSTLPHALFWDSPTDSDNPKNWSFRARFPIAAVITGIGFLWYVYTSHQW
jgi:hypothetical protein